MGIKHLNKFLRDTCQKSLISTHLSNFSNKIITIDVSIYLYKYESINALNENMYLLLSVFRKYNIIPLFVFDGKPPPEKQQIIEQRANDRRQAENAVKQLESELQNTNTEKDKFDIMENIAKMKKKTVFMTQNKINKVKELIESYGASYIEAQGEADEICVSLVLQKKAWACLSEDTDMFAYGCPRVLKYLSLTNHTVILYQMDSILNELNISQQDFRSICVISGTDYNNVSDNVNLYQIIKYLKKYHLTDKSICFYEWLQINTNTNKADFDIPLLTKIDSMYNLNNKRNDTKVLEVPVTNCPIQYNKLQQLLWDDGFIFT